MSQKQRDMCAVFARLHKGPGAFVIPNPFDVGSALYLASRWYHGGGTTTEVIGVGIAAAIVPGAALGAVNGWLIGRLGLPAIIVTLALLVTWRDGLRWVTEGAWVQDLPADFQWFGLAPSNGGCKWREYFFI